ncbi:AraC family transcriptional regulator [Paenibacillus sp. FSL R7-0163]|uniref:helix-turn-helix transcriptional regulator n=1 Tax=Paenibacillus sp. FSL R7-0163 TaxID=2954530 RepID=UPI0030DDDDDB
MLHLNYSKDIEKCVEYIEAHIKENITVEEIATEVGYSVYHFCRVFSLCKEMSVMEYVRSRKLSLASIELFAGKKIIDIALDYGFETQSGFTKLFAKPLVIVRHNMRRGWMGLVKEIQYLISEVIL